MSNCWEAQGRPRTCLERLHISSSLQMPRENQDKPENVAGQSDAWTAAIVDG